MNGRQEKKNIIVWEFINTHLNGQIFEEYIKCASDHKLGLLPNMINQHNSI